ncbi:MAG: stage III sporulation protein AF [Thermoflexaceae bacterium]|nr:stage III sporulation protein AF [Thermoflexaceae bacterium]
MFQEILSIIRKIVIFSLISFVVLELVPKEEYKKYINLFTGMVLIIIIVTPVYELLNQSGSFSDVMDQYLLKSEVRDQNMYFNEYDQMRTEAVISEYKDQMIANITEIIESEQLVANSVDVTFNMDTESGNFLAITGVTAVVAKKYEEESIRIKEIVLNANENAESVQIINIKNKISQFYNIETDNINIIK